MIRDEREIRKNKNINESRKNLQEIARFKRSPEGRRAFILKYMEDEFGKNKSMGIFNEKKCQEVQVHEEVKQENS